MSWKYFNRDPISSERAYKILRMPHVTEKTTTRSENNEFVFKVALDASKSEIRLAVEKVFDVKVLSVNTLRLKGKTKRFRGRLGQRDQVKKAMVRLEEGQSIDVGLGG